MSRVLRVKVDICGRTDCACSVPWAICEEHMPWEDGDEFCARCGWELAAHPLPPPVDVARESWGVSGGKHWVKLAGRIYRYPEPPQPWERRVSAP